MTEPTDAGPSTADQLFSLIRSFGYTTHGQTAEIVDAIVAKWGTPPAVAPWRSAVLDLIDDCPGLPLEQDRWLSRRVKELDFASTPQPTQAQAGAVPLTSAQIEAAAPEYSVDDFLDFNAGVRFAEQHHGIKGGQHGAE